MSNNNEGEMRVFYSTYIYDEYKSVHGIRPRWIDFDAMSIEELKDMADRLEVEVIASIGEDNRREAAAVASFESSVAKAIEVGASDRETAIRWCKDAWAEDGYGEWYGDEHLEYNLGVPFGFFAKLAA